MLKTRPLRGLKGKKNTDTNEEKLLKHHSYYPLGQVTPLEVENGISPASSSIPNHLCAIGG